MGDLRLYLPVFQNLNSTSIINFRPNLAYVLPSFKSIFNDLVVFWADLVSIDKNINQSWNRLTFQVFAS